MRCLRLFASAVALLGVARGAQASPCCMSATAFGMGRLLLGEDFALGLRTSLAPTLGAWDSGGRWRAYETYDELEWRSELWGLVGIGDRFSLSARVPVLVLARSTGAEGDLGGGIGDVALGARYELTSVGEYGAWPALAVTLGVAAPTGRATEDARTALGVDVTGRGAWVLSAGLGAEVTGMPWFVRVDLGLSVPMPAERSDLHLEQRLGPSVDVAVTGGVEVARDVVVSLVPHVTWAAETVLGSRAVADSDRLDVGLAAAGSWRIELHWTVQASVDTGLFVDALGKNDPGRVMTTLGVRYGSF